LCTTAFYVLGVSRKRGDMKKFNRLGSAAIRHELVNSSLLQAVEALAREVHAGQLYGGVDYVDAHLVPVASIVAAMGYGEFYQAAALLHDGPEDNKSLTPGYLFERGVPMEVVEAAFILDKSQYVSHSQYRFEVGNNSLATVAKTGDSLFNLNNILMGKHTFGQEKAFLKVGEYCENLAYLLPRLPERSFI